MCLLINAIIIFTFRLTKFTWKIHSKNVIYILRCTKLAKRERTQIFLYCLLVHAVLVTNVWKSLSMYLSPSPSTCPFCAIWFVQFWALWKSLQNKYQTKPKVSFSLAQINRILPDLPCDREKKAVCWKQHGGDMYLHVYVSGWSFALSVAQFPCFH